MKVIIRNLDLITEFIDFISRVFQSCKKNCLFVFLSQVVLRSLIDPSSFSFTGGIAELTKLLAAMGASIKDIFHERAWLKTSVYMVQVKCIIELRDYEHGVQVSLPLLHLVPFSMFFLSFSLFFPHPISTLFIPLPLTFLFPVAFRPKTLDTSTKLCFL